jgi:hypothetical protein
VLQAAREGKKSAHFERIFCVWGRLLVAKFQKE